MKYCLTLLVLGAAFQGSASARSSLEPCRQNFIDGYHIGVNKRIDDDVALPSSLQITTFPSFEAESGLRIVDSEIYFVEFETSFWGDSYVVDSHGVGRMNFNKPKIVTKARHAQLSAEVVRRVERLYSKAIIEATRSDRIGLDGVAYVFSTSNGACAWAWSPDPNSWNGKLVELMRRLETHTRFSSSMDLQRSEKAIIRYLNAIERTPN